MINWNGVSNNIRSEHGRINVAPSTLKAGQLITGKVLEIYPDQKAAIQFAGKQVVAKLETALTAKQSYFFQVTSTGDILQLKKISEVPTERRPVSDLTMQQLGLPNNRSLKSVMQQLVNQQIPFTAQQGSSLANLLEVFGNNPANRDLLLHMMTQKLPLTESVFQSLQSIQSSQLGSEMRQLYQFIQQMGNKNPSLLLLQQQLSTFISNSSIAQPGTALTQFLANNQQTLQNVPGIRPELMQQIIANPSGSTQQVGELTQQLNQLLQQQLSVTRNDSRNFESIMQRFTALVSQGNHSAISNSFKNHPVFQQILAVLPESEQQIVRQWMGSNQTTAQQNQQVLGILQNVANQQLNATDQNTVRNLLLHLDATNPSLLSVKDRFTHVMKQFIQTSGLLDEATLARSMGELSSRNPLQSIQESLPNSDRQLIQRWLANGQPSIAQNNQIIDLLTQVNVEQLPRADQTMMRNIITFLEANNQQLSKDQLLQMIRQFSTQAEQQINQEQNHSLKQQLLLVNQQQNEMLGDRVQRLIYTLTGLQINLPDNDQLFTQQNLQIPGDKFGLSEDIKMQFEGKQRENNKEIDPDYCRILFHLQLNKLGETYITLTIQKRVINITVYNDTPEITPIINQLKPALKEKLEGLDYHVSAVTQKSIQQTESVKHKSEKKVGSTHTSATEGIDYRI